MRVLGGTNTNQFIKDTAKARRQADLSTSRGSKIFNVASGIFLAVQIGLDIWMTVARVQQCKDIRNVVKQASEDIKPEEQNMADFFVEVKDHYRNISNVSSYPGKNPALI